MINSRLESLADELIKKIQSKKDCFSTTYVVVPNILIQQWLKAYWLKTQGENVLMNVTFETLNEALPDLVQQPNYKVIKLSLLKQIILSIVCDDKENIIPQEHKDYFKDNNVKLNDYVSSLANLLLNYFNDNFEGISGWETSFQKRLYEKVLEECSKYNIGTLEKPIAKTTSDKEIIVFGFAKFEKVYERLINSCSFVEQYLLEPSDRKDINYEILAAPSTLREVETIHSRICKLIQSGENMFDFFVVGPNINDYVNDIERVFRQNDQEFPSIPYVIRNHNKQETEITQALNLLYKIVKNGYYTRLDFADLVSNGTIQKARGIDPDEIENWLKTIINLNIYRNHKHSDDWKYLKKRLLLSKVSSINYEDNVVSLHTGDSLPYTNIDFTDDSILKLVRVINDLDSLIELVNGKTNLDSQLLDSLKGELDKWFSIFNGEVECNKRYKKLVSYIDSIKELGNTDLSIDIFFYCLIEESMINSSQKGNAFTQGITFADLDINSIPTVKHIFFMGASSKNIPVPVVKSELDLRDNIINKDDFEAFSLLSENASEKLTVSFVSQDLKTEEEFYLSPIVMEFNKAQNKYLDGNYTKIHIDQVDSYADLFTRKEFVDKKYYYDLLTQNASSAAAVTTPAASSSPRFYESISVTQLGNYLEEPLKAKASRLFNVEDDLYEKIKDEFEPFTPNALQQSNFVNEMIFQKMSESLGSSKIKFDKNKTKEIIKLNNSLPTVNDDYENKIIDTLEISADLTINQINDITNNNYEIIGPRDIKLFDINVNKEWSLSCSSYFGRSINGNERQYFELKDFASSASLDKFMKLYVISLMDIANLLIEKQTEEEKEVEGNTKYHVSLVKGPEVGDLKKNQDRPLWKYEITPKRAYDLLNIIHAAMGDYSHNNLVPIKYVREKIKSFSDFLSKIFGEHGVWKYFDHSQLFVPEEDLGYDPFSFAQIDVMNELNIQIKLIEFLEEMKLEDYIDEQQ